jgi:hypothetical protein
MSEGEQHQKPMVWERITAVITAIGIVATVLFLVIRNKPFNDPNLVVLLRIILSLATAILGATIPGFFNLKWDVKGVAVRAGGALALFAFTFIFTPKVLPAAAAGPAANIDPLVEQMKAMNARFDGLTNSLSGMSLLVEQKKLIADLYDKKTVLRDRWRDLYAEYSDMNRTNYDRSRFQRQTLSIKMKELVEQVESVNDSLAQLEQRARTNYVELRAPLPPGGFRVVGEAN